MIKTRKLQAKDRLALYKLLQQNEQLTQKEIEQEISYIDEALFNKSRSKFWVVIAVAENQSISGYASYGIEPQLKNTYLIFRIIISPLAKDEGVEDILLAYIEEDIHKKQGRLILTEISTEDSYQPVRNFFLEHDYSRHNLSKRNHRTNNERNFYAKEIC